MKTIDVKNQPTLGAGRTFEITLNGIRYRLFRSAVTVAVIAVAIAFLMNILCEAISMRSIAVQARQRTAERRQAAFWTVRLAAANGPEDILREAAVAEPGSGSARELVGLGEQSDDDFTTYQAGAKQAVAYLDFFNSLDYGHRRPLAGSAQGIEIFTALQSDEAQTRFRDALAKMKSTRLPDSPDAFVQFLASWPQLERQTLAIQRGHQAAVARITQGLRGQSVLELLAQSNDGGGETIRDAGFTAFDADTARIVATQAQQLLEMQLLERSIDVAILRSKLAAQLGGDTKPGDITTRTLWNLMASQKTAAWYLGKMKEANISSGNLTPERVVELAQVKASESSLDNALRLTLETGSGFLGVGTRMAWLVLISLIVCAVGISNAMLMSVTERFREIATLKCLGALDEFIMLLFVMEACLLGLVGGLLGALAGSLIGFGRMLGSFGGLTFSAFPVGAWFAALGISLVAGMVLAAISGVYPSYIAARLAPMEAMRIE